MQEKPFEELPPILPGERVLRKRREPRRRLRLAPNVPGIVRLLKVIATQTPFVPMISVFAVLWLLFSVGIYFAEHEANEHVYSYGQAVWWCLTAIQTMGTPYKPITMSGQVIGAIWAFVGTMTFWGAIIASVTSYFMRPRQRPTKQIIATVQYNLEQLEDLSPEELEVLKETTNGLIDAHMRKVKPQ